MLAYIPYMEPMGIAPPRHKLETLKYATDSSTDHPGGTLFDISSEVSVSIHICSMFVIPSM